MGETNQSEALYAQLCRRVFNWAKEQPSILAVIVIGSRARPENAADEWSDLDMVLFTLDLEEYRSDPSWLQQIGDVLLSVLDHTGRGDPEWLVVFSDGLKGDFAFTRIPEQCRMLPALPELLAATNFYHEAYQRGIYCLLDKTNPENEGKPIPWFHRQSAHTSQDEFQKCMNHFWMEALRAAKFIRRGDLWRAYYTCNYAMKQRVLQMAEWQAQAQHGLEYETWYDGRYLDRWADPRLIRQLPAAFGEYEQSRIRAAFFNTVELFGWLALETASALKLVYPVLIETRILELIRATIGSVR